eukprot:scaffold1527_cov143-Pinguiococcus_pyrenoidosus.AAC.3
MAVLAPTAIHSSANLAFEAPRVLVELVDKGAIDARSANDEGGGMHAHRPPHERTPFSVIVLQHGGRRRPPANFVVLSDVGVAIALKRHGEAKPARACIAVVHFGEREGVPVGAGVHENAAPRLPPGRAEAANVNRGEPREGQVAHTRPAFPEGSPIVEDGRPARSSVLSVAWRSDEELLSVA